MKTRNISLLPHWGGWAIFWLLLLFQCSTISAQIAEWSFENISSSVPGLPIPASTTIDGVSASATLRGGNNNGSPDVCFGAESWSTNFWPTGTGPDPNEYMEFSMRVSGEDPIALSGFFFYSSASSNNSARNFTVYYSTDNFATRQFMFTSTHSAGGCHPHTRSLSLTLTPGQSLKIRIHSFGQNVAAQAATIRVDNVRILGAVLPVTLSTFSAKPERDRVVLHWATEGEINNELFVVERSRDGIYFEAIGEVKGIGNSMQQQHYTFTDVQPPGGQNYYRLRQRDLDGTEEIHRVIPVYFKGSPSSDLIIWPTLVHDRLQVRLPGRETGGQLQLWDMNGRLVNDYSISATNHNNSINVQELSAGTYAVRFTSGRSQYVRRFIKQ